MGIKASGQKDVGDRFGVNASDPTGRGAYFCATSPRVLDRSRVNAVQWSRAAAHLASALRLRRVVDEHRAEAVLSPDGRVLDASKVARRSLAALSRNARQIDRVRTRAHRDALGVRSCGLGICE
jgi:hypothetical protein